MPLQFLISNYTIESWNHKFHDTDTETNVWIIETEWRAQNLVFNNYAENHPLKNDNLISRNINIFKINIFRFEKCDYFS